MNKILSVIIAVTLVFSSVLPAYALENNKHWADDIASQLLNEGIISGDSNGLRLDDYIKRSEFVLMASSFSEYMQ